MSTQSAASRNATRRLLIVDDDPFYREIAAATLQSESFGVITAADGIEALGQLSRLTVDLAIVDLTMPRMDGLALIAKVRQGSLNRHTPIIVVTGSDDTDSIERAFASGATSFVAKPINWPLFAQHVNYVYRAAQTEAELRHTMRTSQFLSELKDKLLTVLVSEFQAPLRIAHSATEVLRKEMHGPLGETTYKECAEDLGKALQRITVTQLKMMEAGKVLGQGLLLKEEMVPLLDLMLETLEPLREKAERRAIRIAETLTLPRNIVARADRSLLGQAFRLMIDGAVQFAPPKSTIVLEALIDTEAGFRLTVTDKGPALPQSVVRRILDSHVGADPGASALGRNTGLTICRALADAHHGTLNIASSEDTGNVTSLGLPRNRLISTETSRPSPALSAQRRGPIPAPEHQAFASAR